MSAKRIRRKPGGLFAEPLEPRYCMTVPLVTVFAEQLADITRPGLMEFNVRLSEPTTAVATVRYTLSGLDRPETDPSEIVGPRERSIDRFVRPGGGGGAGSTGQPSVFSVIRFAPGETQQTLRVLLAENGVRPAMPAFSLLLSDPHNCVLGNQKLAFTSFEWRVADGGNGHAYALVLYDVHWEGALERLPTIAPPPGFQAGNLVSITSEEEQVFLASHFHRTAWMGFADELIDGEWRWIDGSPGLWQDPTIFDDPVQTTYVNWAFGEPSSFFDVWPEDYGLFGWGSGWNDGMGPDNGALFPFIVEFVPLATVD